MSVECLRSAPEDRLQRLQLLEMGRGRASWSFEIASDQTAASQHIHCAM